MLGSRAFGERCSPPKTEGCFAQGFHDAVRSLKEQPFQGMSEFYHRPISLRRENLSNVASFLLGGIFMREFLRGGHGLSRHEPVDVVT